MSNRRNFQYLLKFFANPRHPPSRCSWLDQLEQYLCRNPNVARQKRKREREGCIYLTDLPIPHVAQYTLSQLYIGHIRRCLLQRERLSHQTGTLPVPLLTGLHAWSFKKSPLNQRDTELTLWLYYVSTTTDGTTHCSIFERIHLMGYKKILSNFLSMTFYAKIFC